jgi:hypothetical protein
MSALLFTLVLVGLLIGNAIDSGSEWQGGAIFTLSLFFLAPLLLFVILAIAFSAG